MLDNFFSYPEQTHVGWRTPSTEAGNGHDHLVIAEQPVVTFVNQEDSPQKNTGSLPSDSSVEDSTFEGPSFLWSSAEEGGTGAPPEDALRQPSTPLVVFGDASDQPEQEGATIFS